MTWCAMAFAAASIPAQAQDSEVSKLREELNQLQRQLAAGYALAAASYAAGLMLSLASDLPPSPLIVCVMAVLGLAALAARPLRGG